MIKLLVSIAGVDSDGSVYSYGPGEVVSFKEEGFDDRLVESGQAVRQSKTTKATKKTV